MNFFKVGVLSLSLVLLCLVQVQIVQAYISKEEANKLLQTQFIERSDKNIDAYMQAINLGMTNKQAVENIEKIKNLDPNSAVPVYITGGQWSYEGNNDNKTLVFTPSNAFVPAVPEDKRNFNYTDRRVKGIEEVIDESSGGSNFRNREIERYNDAFDDLKKDLRANGLEESPMGRRILREYREYYPEDIATDNDNMYDYNTGITSMKVERRGDDGLNRYAQVKKVAQEQNIDLKDVVGFEVGGDGVLRVQASDGKMYPPPPATQNNQAGSQQGGAAQASGGGTAQTTTTASSTTQGGIVPCGKDGQSSCTICDLVEGIHRIVKFITGLIFVTGIVIITVAGIMYMVSGGNTSTTQLAKTAMKNAVIGIIVILTAFILITFIINTVFQNQGSGLKVQEGGLKGFASRTWTFECN